MANLNGFIGGSYVGRAINASAENSINWYPERVEDPNAASKTQFVLLPKPGLQVFANTNVQGAVLALIEVNGRAFAIANGTYLSAD